MSKAKVLTLLAAGCTSCALVYGYGDYGDSSVGGGAGGHGSSSSSSSGTSTSSSTSGAGGSSTSSSTSSTSSSTSSTSSSTSSTSSSGAGGASSSSSSSSGAPGVIVKVDGVTGGGSGITLGATLTQLQLGDVVVAMLWWDVALANITPPGGWTLQATDSVPTSGEAAWFSHVVGAGDVPPYQFKASEPVGWRLMYVAFRNATSVSEGGPNTTPTTPFKAAPAGSAYSLPSVLTSGPNELILHLGTFATDPAAAISWTTPPGLTLAGYGSGIAAFYEYAPAPAQFPAVTVAASKGMLGILEVDTLILSP